MQPAVSICVQRVTRAIVNAGTRNKWVHFPRTTEVKAAVKEEFLWFGPLPGVIGCVYGIFVASRSDDGYPFEPWLVVLVKGRPHMDSAEQQPQC
ncbi:hypothetical protein MRX96_011633 [Rhipicephalus microplus]